MTATISTYPATQSTVAEAAAMTSGGTYWSTEKDQLGRRTLLTDGPHGVRYQAGQTDHLGIAASEPATCFPPAAGLAQSWDPQLVERVGVALGIEARHSGVGVLLGPGINIRRDPRGGRNFEYFSEDPHLSGDLGAAWVKGVQSVGVGASLKHFAANNCETDRMRSSSEIPPRALREIYLKAFEHVIATAAPWTVMCSYNKLNGVLASENAWLLTGVLREEWGFDGAVVSDWGAVADRVAAVSAGLDLTMPGGGTASGDQQIVDAVADGALDAAVVHRAAERVEALIARAVEGAQIPVGPLDLDAHHALAREAAGRSIALLKNDGQILPLADTATVAVIGPFATAPRYQGGGSSHVNAAFVDVPLEQITRRSGTTTTAHGLTTSDLSASEALAEASRVASEAEVAVVFLGLEEQQESEGIDRTTIDLPGEQLALLRAVVEAQSRTVVVLSHGGVVDLTEVAALAPAILDGGLLGQAGGGAIADVLFGRVNPSGRLTETVPARLEDAPSFLNFPGEHSRVVYGEGVFVGYRGYDALDRDVAFPFGHGLTYTSFEYGALTAASDGQRITVSVPIVNTGERSGREIVQIYVGHRHSAVQRAPRELRGYAAVELEPGEASVARITIERADLAYWEDRTDSWVVEGGEYQVWAGASSRDLRSRITIRVEPDPLVIPLSRTSTLGEIGSHPIAGPMLSAMLGQGGPAADAPDELGGDMQAVAAAIPIDRLAVMSGGVVAIDVHELAELFAQANRPA